MANELEIVVADVENAYEGEIDTDDTGTTQWVQGQIDKAVRALIAECRTLKARLSAGTVDPLLVKDVVIDAVLRVIRDEDPTLKSESDSGYSYTKNPLSAAGDIWFPDKDLRRLGCSTGSGGFVGKARMKPGQPWGGPL